jgi:hypothetical protein
LMLIYLYGYDFFLNPKNYIGLICTTFLNGIYPILLIGLSF